MSTRIATMSNSYSPLKSRLSGFIRKLVVILSFVIGIAVFISLLNLHQKNLSPLWMTTFAILSVGLAVGSSTRAVFYEWSGYVRFFAVVFIVPLGLFILGFLTGWEMGVGPLDPWLRKVIDREQLIQLGGALLVAILCLEAWWKPHPKIEDVPDFRGISDQREPVPTAVSIQSPRPRSSSHVQPGRSWTPKFLKARKTRSNKTPVVSKLTFGRAAQSARPKHKRLFSRKPKLQLSVFEEHRCPYCLDVVKRNDPRGIKECDVCHSLHHADCWAITGQCQVPHLNS